ncbi:thermonuclease family protein [Nonomuraea sp. NPDC050663]|uniref:thermonuclease family protein n=1 Tax=Nonomuraea sp. NPDC050663 TaxID=3364370 RepID=UPI0037A9A8B7
MRPTLLVVVYIVLLTVVGTAFYRTRVLPEQTAGRTAGATTPVPLSPEGSQEAARVVWISDGDTIVVRPLAGPYAGQEQRIRLIGLDAPETHPAPQCWARESTAALLKLLPRGSTVKLAFDDRRIDDYGRQLRYAWNASGTLVNSEQLAQGNAFVLRIWPNVEYEKAFADAAAAAQRAKRGLWGSCPNPQPPVHTPRAS